MVVISAAAIEGTAWERNGQGIFTRHWVELLARPHADLLTYQAAVELLTTDIQAEVPSQLPQVEGKAALKLFSGPVTACGPAVVKVRRHQDGSLWLPMGQVHGVTQGSRYRLFREEPKSRLSSAAIGEAEVGNLEAFNAQLHITPGMRIGDVASIYAIEAEHAHLLDKLRIVLLDCAPGSPVAGVVAQLGIVKRVDWPDAELALRCQADREEVALLRPDGSSPWTLTMNAAQPNALQAKLQTEWRRVQLYRLRHDIPGSPITLTFFHDEHDSKQISVGLRLHNGSPRYLYVALFAVTPSGAVRLRFAEEFAHSSRIGPEQSVELALGNALHSLAGQTRQRVVIKALLSDTYVDISDVDTWRDVAVRPDVLTRTTHSAKFDSLQGLLDQIGQGMDDRLMRIPTADWQTAETSLTID